MSSGPGSRQLVGPIILASAAILSVLAVLVWTGVLPVDDGARAFVALGLFLAAGADAVVGLVLMIRANS